jgi:hypothetical protein
MILSLKANSGKAIGKGWLTFPQNHIKPREQKKTAALFKDATDNFSNPQMRIIS